MSVDATVLAIGVDASEVPQADAALAKLEGTSKRVESQNDKMAESFARSAQTLGKSRSEVMALEAQWAGLTGTQRQIADEAIKATRAFEQQEAAMRQLKTEAIAVGVAFTAVTAAAVKFFEKWDKYADQLGKVAGQTGLTAQQVGELGFAAEQSDATLTTLTSRLGALADRAADAATGNKKAAAAFDAMGVSVTNADGSLKGQRDLLLEIADKFATYRDGTAKAALAQELFGRGGRELIPLLNQGSAGILEMGAQYRALGGDVDKAVEVQDEYEKSTKALDANVTLLAKDFSGPIMSALTAVNRSFVQGTTDGSAFAAVGGAIGIALKGIASIATGALFVLNQFGKALGALGAIAVSLVQGEFSQAVNIAKEFNADFAKSIAQNAAKISTIWADAAKDVKTAGDKMVQDAPTPRVAERERVAREKISNEMKLLMADYDRFADLLVDVSAHGAQYDKTLESLDRLYAAGIITLDQYVDAEERAFSSMSKVAKEAERLANESLRRLIEAEQRLIETEGELQRQATAALGAYAEQNDRIALEVSLIGQSNQVRERALILFDAEIERKKLIAASDVKGLELLDKEIEKRLELANIKDAKLAAIEYQNSWLDALTNVSRSGADFIVDFVRHGGSAFKNLWDSFKDWALRAFAEIAARKVVVSVVAAFAPGLASAAGGQPANLLDSILGGGQGGGFDLGKLFSKASSGFYDFGNVFDNFLLDLDHGVGMLDSLSTAFDTMAGAAGNVLGTIGAGAGIGYAVGSIGASLFGNSRNQQGMQIGGSIGGTAGMIIGGPLGALIGAAIGTAVGSLFKSGGGPKSGGFAGVGDLSGITNTDSSGRYFTPNTADAELAKTIATVNEGYLAMAKALGITAGNVGFALGFDTDPKGTAPNRVHATTFQNGQSVYDAALGDLGRDDQALQDRLALEAKRILFAALQASVGDAPEYIAKLFEGVDAATASAEQIDQILATAQALKLVVDTVSGLGDRFAALDPEQITALTEAFGGLQAFLDSATFLNANFTTDAEKTAAATQQLNDAFASLGVAVPSTHQAFLDLLSSLDLTTEQGRASYAAISKLAPLFVQVYGTAQQAAEKTATVTAQLTEEENRLAEARKAAIANANDFFNANFYSDQEKAAATLQANWNIVHDAWTEMGAQLLDLGYSAIPTTNAAFRQLIETLRAQGLNDLADSLVLIAPAIFGINEAIATMSTTAETASAAIDKVNEALSRSEALANAASGAFNTVTGAIDSLINDSGLDFGAKLALRLQLIPEQLAKVDQEIADAMARGELYSPYMVELQKQRNALLAMNGLAAKELARYTVLAAQYDENRAEQLVKLEEWYADMQTALGGSTEALAALEVLFKQKWDAIINGTSDGVNGTLDEFKRLQQGIQDFLNSLKLGQLSPLTPAQKLAEAQTQYQDLLAKAQGGDLDALGKITGAAQAYLEIARQFYASSSAYTAIFNSVTSALESLATMEKPATTQEATNAALVSALPTNGKIVSAEDLKSAVSSLATEFAASIAALAASNASDSQAERATVDRQTQALQSTSDYK